MNRLLYVRNLVIPALCALALAGCDGCSSSTNPKEPLIITPKPGSGFIYTYYNTDENDQPIEQTRQTTARSVIKNGATVMGKDNVVQYLEDADTISVHYEENGDASFLQMPITYPNNEFGGIPNLPIPSFTIPSRWVTFGYGSKTQMVVPRFDTVMSTIIGGFPVLISVQANGTTMSLGDENLSINGETIATNKGLLTVNVAFNASLLMAGTITTVDTIWFAPKLGMFVKDDGFTRANLPQQFGGNRAFGGTFNTLISYSMK